MTAPEDRVEITIYDAKNLLRALAYAEVIPGLSSSFGALREAIDKAENPSVFDRLRRGWNEGFERGRQRARGETIGNVGDYLDEDPEPAGVEPVPQWENVAKAIRLIEREMLGDAKATSEADRLQAYVRDTFDALGISIRHEPSLYVAMTTASLLVELAENGREKGIVEGETVLAVAQIAQSFAASLIPYLPPEARR